MPSCGTSVMNKEKDVRERFIEWKWDSYSDIKMKTGRRNETDTLIGRYWYHDRKNDIEIKAYSL